LDGDGADLDGAEIRIGIHTTVPLAPNFWFIVVQLISLDILSEMFLDKKVAE